MKRMLISGSVALFVLVLSFTAFANDIGTARLSLVQGDVLISNQDTGGEWAAASINLPVLSGDRIWVPAGGRAEIQFLGRTYLRADGNTEVELSKVVWDGGSRIIQATVPEGSVYVNYRTFAGRDSVFQVDTPLVSVMTYEDTRYDLQVRDDGYTEVSVYSGLAYVESPKGRTRVSRGNMISIGPDDYAEISPLGMRSEWVRWNESRDSQITRYRDSSRYLPPELDVYSSDLDENGSWTYIRDYGYVWRPAVVVGGWAPYRYGRWIWMRGDYVWISYEPWGWAPHHYGRWAFRSGFGWFWVPPAVHSVFWSPGFVAWIYTPTYVSWVPLAPREVYYGHGYYGPYSVNVTNVHIKNVNVTNVYVNSRVTNAVTVVHRDTFLTGRTIKGDGRPDNPFLHALQVSPGRPDIKPVKATVMPLPDKAIPERSLPPRRTIETAKTKVVEERRIALKQDSSVFREGDRAAPLPIMKSDKPRPVMRGDQRDKRSPSLHRTEIPLQPRVEPKGPEREPARMPSLKGRASEQKGIMERPPVNPREADDRGKIIERERGASQGLQPRGREIPSGAPRDTGGRVPAGDKSPERPWLKREMKAPAPIPPERRVEAGIPGRQHEMRNLKRIPGNSQVGESLVRRENSVR